jgi:O-antigen/teichoic acid export membrane protein
MSGGALDIVAAAAEPTTGDSRSARSFSWRAAATNVGWLTCLQASAYLLPLLTIPYLARVLGAEAFGIYAVFICGQQYAAVVIDYGFNLSATREAALSHRDPARLASLYRAVSSVRLTLGGVAFILLSLVSAHASVGAYRPAVWVSGVSAIGWALFPGWVLQGLERMAAVTAIQVVTRLAVASALVAWVRGPADLTIALLLYAAGTLAGGVGATLFVRVTLNLHMGWPDAASVRQVLHDGRDVFVSTLATSTYVTGAGLWVACLAGPIEAGVFVAADKLVRAASAAFTPVWRGVYPALSHLSQGSAASDNHVQWTLGAAAVLAGGIAGALMWFFADALITLAVGSGPSAGGATLRMLAFVPLLIMLGSVLGHLTLLPKGYTAGFRGSYLRAAAVHLAVVAPLTTFFGAVGAAAAVTMAEAVVVLSLAWTLTRLTGERRGSPC